MVSKPKNKTYIILEIGPYGSRKTIIGRYKVGAKNEKEALVLIKSKYGKHKAFNIYYIIFLFFYIKRIPYNIYFF